MGSWGPRTLCIYHAINPGKSAKIAAGGARHAEHTRAVPAVPSARAGWGVPTYVGVGGYLPMWQKSKAKLRVRRPSVVECGVAAGPCVLAVVRRPRPPTRLAQSVGHEVLFSHLRFAQKVLPARRRPSRAYETSGKSPSNGRPLCSFEQNPLLEEDAERSTPGPLQWSPAHGQVGQHLCGKTQTRSRRCSAHL